MVVIASNAVHVHGECCRLGKALEEVRNHLTAQIADFLPLQTQIDYGEWPSRQIDDSTTQCLVQWRIGMPKALVAFDGSESFFDRTPKSDSAVLRRVMVVDCY